MQKLVRVLILTLLITIARPSHAMSGEIFSHLEPLAELQRRRLQQPNYNQQYYNYELPLPLKRRDMLDFGQTDEQPRKRTRLTPSEQESTLQATSSSSSSSTSSEQAAGESLLERLPLELFEHIRESIPPQHRGALASASTFLRDRSQFLVKHIAIPIRNITEEMLNNISQRFEKVTSITIYASTLGEELTPEKIALLARAFPNITSLDVSYTGLKPKGIQALARPGVFKDLKKLNLAGNRPVPTGNLIADIIRVTPDSAIINLLNASFTNKLEMLNLDDTGITEIGTIPLIVPGKFIALKELHLARNNIGDKGIARLVHAPFAHTLELLNLRETGATPAGITALAKSKKFLALKSLDLSYNGLFEDGIIALAQAPFAHNLESLNVSRTFLTEAGVQTLSKPDAFPALKSLDLSHNRVDIAALTNAPFAGNLESLNLRCTLLDSTDISLLSRPNALPELKELNLAYNKITIQGFNALTNAPFAHNLESLNLAGTGMVKTATEIVSKPNAFVALKKLNIASNKIGDRGIATLAHAPFASKLESLNLSEASITAIGIETLSQPNAFPALKELNLAHNNIGTQSLTALMNAPFAHTLELLNLEATGISIGYLRRLLYLQGVSTSQRIVIIDPNKVGERPQKRECLLRSGIAEQIIF